MKNINDKIGNLLTNEGKIMERWRQYSIETADQRQQNQEKENTQQRGNITSITKKKK